MQVVLNARVGSKLPSVFLAPEPVLWLSKHKELVTNEALALNQPHNGLGGKGAFETKVKNTNLRNRTDKVYHYAAQWNAGISCYILPGHTFNCLVTQNAKQQLDAFRHPDMAMTC